MGDEATRDARLEAIARDVRRDENRRQRDAAFRFIDAWRAVREETGYGAITDAVQWAQRVVEGRG